MDIPKFFQQAVKAAASDWLDFAFPRACVCCGDLLLKSEMEICWVCYAQLPFSVHHFGDQNPIAKAMRGRVPLYGGYYLLNYQSRSMVSQVLKSIKYDGGVIMAKKLGALMGDELKSKVRCAQIDALVPVPMHPKKALKRGYNPALILAQGISSAMGIPVIENALVKRNVTVSQTHKNRLERWYETKHIFEFGGTPENVKCVALVDDVFTTGATAERCIRSLYDGGMERVSMLTLAYTT